MSLEKQFNTNQEPYRKSMDAPGVDFLSRETKKEMLKAMIADDGKPGKSLKETSTDELKATLAKLKPTDPGAEARIKAIKDELSARTPPDFEKAQPSESTSLTPEKARQMLHERSGGHGRPITEQQRKFFGAVGGHLPAPGGKAKKSMATDLDDWMEKATPIGGITPGGYKRVKKDVYVKVSKEEHGAQRAKEQERAASFDIMALLDPNSPASKQMAAEEAKYQEAQRPVVASAQIKTMMDQGASTADIVGVMDDLPKGSILRVQYHPDDPVLTVRKVDKGGMLGNKWQIDTSKLPPDKKEYYTGKTQHAREVINVLQFPGKKIQTGARPIPEPKGAGAGAKPASFNDAIMQAARDNPGNSVAQMFKQAKPERALRDLELLSMDPRYKDEAMALLDSANKLMKKSMERPMSLEDWMEKAGPYIGKRGGKWADPEHKIPWKEGMEGKTMKVAEHAGQGRSLGGGVEVRANRSSKTGKWSGTIIGKTGKTLPGATGDTAKEAMDATEKMFRQSGGGAGGEGEKKPAGEKPAAPAGLPKPKMSKIGNATIRDYGEHGIIRSQPGLGHTVLDVEGTEVGEIGEHKSLKSAEKKLLSMKKSQDDVFDLMKSGGLPTHQQGMGHKKSSAVEGGSADGGELAGVGMTSGSSDSAAGPGQDSQGQLKGVPTGGKAKLSDDDADVDGQMKPHKKPIETIKKSAFPADQRESVAHEQAAQVSQLQKSEDVYIGPDRHPYSHHRTHASGDAEASELVKSEAFYHGGSPQTAPQRPIIEQGVLCKSVNMAGCGVVYSAALTSCPECGAGTVGHRHLPGGPAMGAEMTILEKSIGPGPLLRRPPQEPDIKIG